MTVTSNEAALAHARAELDSINARIAADNARYKGGAGNPQELSRAASKAERLASLRAAETKLASPPSDLAPAVQEKGEVANKPRKRLYGSRKRLKPGTTATIARED